MWRWVAILVALLGLAAVASLAISPKGVPVDVANAQRQLIREYVEEQAKTRLPDTYQVTMPLQGRVRPIELNEGDVVEQGQIVAHLDPSDLQTDLIERQNSVAQYEKSIEQIDLAIEQAEQTVLASQAGYDFAEREFSRSKTLRTQNSLSQSELEASELRLIQAKLDLRKDQLNQSMYVILRGIIQLIKETNVAQQSKAQRDLDRAVIRSPASGIVLSKDVANERVLSAGEVLLEIGDLNALQIESEILTQDVVKICIDDPVDIEGAAIGARPVSGHVAQVYPQGFTKISSLGVEQQRVLVVVEFDPGVMEQLRKEGRTLGVDYRLRVRIFTGQKENSVTIPRAALFRSASGEWQTFVVRDGLAQRVNVEIGLRNDFDVEIIRGVSEGEAVIIAPDSTLTNDTLVEIQTSFSASNDMSTDSDN